jgi:hypothetical protein
MPTKMVLPSSGTATTGLAAAFPAGFAGVFAADFRFAVDFAICRTFSAERPLSQSLRGGQSRGNTRTRQMQLALALTSRRFAHRAGLRASTSELLTAERQQDFLSPGFERHANAVSFELNGILDASRRTVRWVMQRCNASRLRTLRRLFYQS